VPYKKSSRWVFERAIIVDPRASTLSWSEISSPDTCPNEKRKGTLSCAASTLGCKSPVAQGSFPCGSDACSLPRDYLSLFSSRPLVLRGLREYRVIDLRSILDRVLVRGCCGRSEKEKKNNVRSTTSDWQN